ncbi:RNA methyltransferase [Halopelagius longus]|uniref:RNA methyltransferase n=1 Tax=Halopelagius longus TaxID=1236180 RepID=A0A1H0ZD49_9EURY|nr:RNA methyltransferase [Halopelagius longus]RDI72949.1 RNA methyltransferase [Halopelagius longus]SDQ25347.1 RNA methyltransferase, TrmH family, group 1 [Halopelagius longus]
MPPRQRKPVVVVVEPKTPGNIGTIARAMKNFGLTDLKLVDPPEMDRDSEAYGFAGHAREDVLPNAEEVTFEEVVENYHTVGTTAITNEDSRRHVRFPYKTPVEVRESLETVETKTALVFGREGKGLNNEELAQLDEVCSIPASSEYPVLNLGQAATVLMYELRSLTVEETQLPDVERERADEADIDRFYDFFSEFLDSVEHRDHKRPKTMRMMRRLLGRAHPTEREVHTLIGIFRRANRYLGERAYPDDSDAADSDAADATPDAGTNAEPRPDDD